MVLTNRFMMNITITINILTYIDRSTFTAIRRALYVRNYFKRIIVKKL